jgi:integrase
LYLQAFEEALKTRENRRKADPKSKKRSANEVLASAGENSDTYVCRKTLDDKYRPAIKKFCSEDDLGGLLIKDVTVSDIRMHLELLDLAISTYNDRINGFSRFFKWCMDPEREYLNASPAAGLTRLKDEWHEPEILTVDQVSRVFRAAEEIDPGLIPELTLRTHAGLRTCEINRMNEKDVYWKYKLIDIRKEVAKSRSPDKPLPRKIEGLPNTVWEWLTSVGGENFKLDRVNRCKRMQAVFKKAEVEYKKNCLRHGFCSYGFSLTGDDGKVRKWSGHRTERSFYDNYVNVSLTSKAEATDYFAILPTANHVARLGLRRRRHQPTINWPTTEELQKLIATMSNVKIGKRLGCTEAAVRKERKKRGI